MSADDFVSRLDGVRRGSQPGVYRARCPSHEGRSTSLAVRELADGRVLVHCFAGCPVEAVLAAVGMTFDDLFPERSIGHARSARRPFPAADILACVGNESLIVATVAADIAAGRPVAEADRTRCIVAASRLQRATEAAHAR